MKVGDLVQYIDHERWNSAGLGIVMDVKEALLRCGSSTLAFQIAWFDDIEKYGWSETIEDHAWWYDDADFKRDITLFSEAT